MNRPAFQFYTKDWRASLKLRRCSDAARGAWIDLICVMHESEEYGVLRWPLKEIAHTSKIKLQLLRELAEKGVLKGANHDVPAFIYTPKHAGKSLPSVTLLKASPGPMWYCSRMVKDEWVRGRRGESTRFSTDRQPSPDKAPKPVPTRALGEPPGYGPASAVAFNVISSVLDVTTEAPAQTAATPDPQPPPPNPRLAKILTECNRAKVHDATPASPTLAAWIQQGATDHQISAALTLARTPSRVPFPAKLTLAYVDPILQDILAADRKAAVQAIARVQRTQALITEQRDAKALATPPPIDNPTIQLAMDKLRRFAKTPGDDPLPEDANHAQ